LGLKGKAKNWKDILRMCGDALTSKPLYKAQFHKIMGNQNKLNFDKWWGKSKAHMPKL